MGGTRDFADDAPLEASQDRNVMYGLRKRGPDDLRTQLGKREEKRSLETRDPAEATQRLAAVLAELDKRWANLRAGSRALTGREAHEIAVRAHDAHLARYLENPEVP